MTNLLVRLFIKDAQNYKKTAVRTAYGNLASYVGVICNILLFLGKFTVGTLFGSIAITADAVNNLADASSNIISLVGFKLGAKKADADHPFGHARYEYIAGLCVCALILAIGFSLLKESFFKVLAPTEVAFSWLSVAVLLVSIVVKLWMSRFNAIIGKRIQSDTLIATAADSRNDVISTGAVLVAAFLCRYTGHAIYDGLMGLGVAIFILISGYGLLRDTLSPLLGRAPDPALVKAIEDKVRSCEGVLGVHDLIVHDYGPGQQFASLHLEFDADSDVLKVHDLIDNIEHYFLKEYHLLTTIHYDPIVTQNQELDAARSYLRAFIKGIDPSFLMHDVRMVQGDTHTNIIFDLAVPAGWHGDEAALVAQISQAAQTLNPKYLCVIEIETSYTGM
ncbi:MAG: cation diffusion facilitator family transporter [Faecalibacterium sp.]